MQYKHPTRFKKEKNRYILQLNKVFRFLSQSPHCCRLVILNPEYRYIDYQKRNSLSESNANLLYTQTWFYNLIF